MSKAIETKDQVHILGGSWRSMPMEHAEQELNSWLAANPDKDILDISFSEYTGQGGGFFFLIRFRVSTPTRSVYEDRGIRSV